MVCKAPPRSPAVVADRRDAVQPILRTTGPGRAIDVARKEAIRNSFDRLAPRRDVFRLKNRYYYALLLKYLRFMIRARGFSRSAVATATCCVGSIHPGASAAT